MSSAWRGGTGGMRKLVITENITVDGVIEATENWFGPSGADLDVDQSDQQAVLQEQMDGADAVLFGRVTFEQMRSYWPHQTDDTTGVTDYLNRVTKYVASRTLEEPEWAHTRVLRGPLAEEVAGLKTAPGRDIVCTGSVTLAPALIGTGLVDEYRLFVYPVVLGRGARLFADATTVGDLRLAETRPFRSGVVLMRYVTT
jgi:dihydrofolate reductase